MRNKIIALCLLAVGLVLPASAADVRIDNAWVRATAPGQRVAAAYMELTAETEMALTGGSTPASESVELHYMAMKDGEMIMRQMDTIALPKGRTVTLGPGGLHVMLIGLPQQLKEGDTIRLRLDFKDGSGKSQSRDLQLPVRRAAARMRH